MESSFPPSPPIGGPLAGGGQHEGSLQLPGAHPCLDYLSPEGRNSAGEKASGSTVHWPSNEPFEHGFPAQLPSLSKKPQRSGCLDDHACHLDMLRCYNTHTHTHSLSYESHKDCSPQEATYSPPYLNKWKPTACGVSFLSFSVSVDSFYQRVCALHTQ